MAKRILAIVMAVALSLTMFSLSAFAAVSGSVTTTVSGSSITLVWQSLTDAARYEVRVTNSAGTTVATANPTTNTATVNVGNAYGNMNVSVLAYSSNNSLIGSFTGTAYVAQSYTSGGITVTGTSTGVSRATWTAQAGVSTYYVSWVSSVSGETSSNTTNTNSIDIPVEYSHLTSITVKVGNSSGYNVGTWYPNGTGTSGGGYGNWTVVESQGSVYIESTTGYLRWTGTSSSYYTIQVRVNGSIANSMTSYNNVIDVNNYLNTTTYASTVSFYVYSGTPSVSTEMGHVTVRPGTYSQGSQGSGSVYIDTNGYLRWSSSMNYFTITITGNGYYDTKTVTLYKYLDVRSYLNGYYGVLTFSVYAGTPSSVNLIGTVTANSSYGYTGNSALYWDGTYIRWAMSGYTAPYYVRAYNAAGTQLNVGDEATYNGSNYYDCRGYINMGAVRFVVTDATNRTIGEISYGTTGTGTGGAYSGAITVTRTGSYLNVSWTPMVGAAYYRVTYGSRSVNVQSTSVQLEFTGAMTISVSYATAYNSYYYPMGSVYVDASGNATGSTNNGLSSNPNNSSTVYGNNCTVTVGATSSIVRWNGVSNTTVYQYMVIYEADGKTYGPYTTTANTATIPVGSDKSFTVTVIAATATGNMPIATAMVTATTASTPSTSTSSGLTLTAQGTACRVSWSSVSSAVYYTVNITRPGYGGNEVYLPMGTTYYDLTFTKNTTFTVTVYAYNSGDRASLVGTATHVAGTDFDVLPSESTQTLPSVVTGFKGTTGDKKVNLSWNAVAGATTYEVYWKRSSNSTWKKAGEISKRSVNISGLNNNMSYDFKVVANGKDSGILTMSPSAGATATYTAPDPSGTTSTSSKIVITSAVGGKGTATVTWTGISGNPTYEIKVANVNSSNPSKYYYVTSTSSTSATLKLAAGTYKVRIKAVNSAGKELTALADCDYFTVTVS